MHRHVWKVVDREQRPSVAEEARKHGYEIESKRLWTNEIEDLILPREIVTYRCQRCGTEKVKQL